jgi:hypothetical protein
MSKTEAPKAKPRYLVESPLLDPFVGGKKDPDGALARYLEQKHADGYDVVAVLGNGRYVFRAV